MTEKKKGRKIFRVIGKIFSGLLILLIGLLVFGLVNETVKRNKYHAEYPPMGQMVSVGDHELHLYCVGSGSPTVVFEADLDQYGSLVWGPVQEEIGKITRACSYDRAGIMWSEPGPRPRDGETIAAELKTVLEAAGEEGPYLLVGHAFGGAYVRIFAGNYPDDVCGMVLLESSHPDMLTRFEELGGVFDIPDQKIRPLILLLSHLGSPGRWKGNIYDLSLDIYDPVQAYLPESSMAWFDEKVESMNTLRQSGQYQYLGDFPLILVVSSTTSSVAHGQEYQDMWVELQNDLLSLTDNSEIRFFEVGHYPQLQNPDLAIEAIQDVLESCN